MSVIVHIPTILRGLTQERKRVEAQGCSVLEVINHLEALHPGVKGRLVSKDEPHRFINLYVNEEDIRFLHGLDTAVQAGDSVTILPAVAGGSGRRPC